MRISLFIPEFPWVRTGLNRDCIHTGLRLQRGDEHNKKRSLGSWRLLLLRVILIHLKGDPHHDVTAPEVSNLCLLYSDFIVEFTKRVERVPGDPIIMILRFHSTRSTIVPGISSVPNTSDTS